MYARLKVWMHWEQNVSESSSSVVVGICTVTAFPYIHS